MILVVDNYDSFTWNLVLLLRAAGGDGTEVRVVLNDALDLPALRRLAPCDHGATTHTQLRHSRQRAQRAMDRQAHGFSSPPSSSVSSSSLVSVLPSSSRPASASAS